MFHVIIFCFQFLIGLHPLFRKCSFFNAFCTAHPGSTVCVQSRKRHCSASSSMSEKVRSMPLFASHMPSSRIPGVSMTIPPSGKNSNSRCVVVCRPLSSFLMPPVARRSSPSSRLTSVDFPTPEEPKNAAVVPAER